MSKLTTIQCRTQHGRRLEWQSFPGHKLGRHFGARKVDKKREDRRGDPRPWHVIHLPTGFGIGRLWTLRECRAYVCDLEPLRDWSSADPEEYRRDLGRFQEVRERYLRPSQERANRELYGPPPGDKLMTLRATNCHTGEVHETKWHMADLQRAQVMGEPAMCAGPCECQPLEPDAHCADGWPAVQQAIIEGGLVHNE